MYNPYNPIQPYSYGVNPYTQANQSSQPQMTTNKIIVSGLDEVRMRMQPTNSEMIYLDNEKSLLYQKTVDNTGHFEVKVFDISEHKAPEIPPKTEVKAEPTNYVTQEAFDSLQKEFRALKDKVAKGASYAKGN